MFWSLLLCGTSWNHEYGNFSLFPLEDYFNSSLSLDSWGWNLVFTMMVLRSMVFGRQLNRKAESWLWEELLIKGTQPEGSLFPFDHLKAQHVCTLKDHQPGTGLRARRKLPSLDSRSTSSSTLNFLCCRSMRDTFLLLMSYPASGIFVMAVREMK